MAISSVTLLNSSGVDASLAVLRESGAKDLPAAQAPTTSASSVVSISARGKALVSLDSLQASAEAIRNANVPPTLADFKVLVGGVVSSINSLRKSVAAVANSQSSLANALRKRLDAIDEFASKPSKSSTALRDIGIGRQNDGGFAVNSKLLVKTFNGDGKGAFATLAEFANKVASDSTESEPSRSAKAAEKAKERGKDRGQEVSDTSAKSNGQVDLMARVDQSPSLPASFIAKSAVASYSTISSL
jgi:hypothetical protein